MKHGFSLVELSIVLVILGLLTGGILAGQNLIRAAEIRSLSTQVNAVRSAVHTFKDKYFALPGDMRNATDFWGTDPDGCPTHTVRTAKQETCNGSGDGRISNTSAEYGELFRAWQQLANAGLMEGSYTGITGAASGYHALPGDNVPRTRVGEAGIAFNYYHGTIPAGNTLRFQGNYGNVITLGVQTGSNGLYGNFLSTEEAWNLDTKMDDGRPGFGSFLSYKNSSDPNCASTNDRATAEYVLTSSGAACSPLLKAGF